MDSRANLTRIAEEPNDTQLFSGNNGEPTNFRLPRYDPTSVHRINPPPAPEANSFSAKDKLNQMVAMNLQTNKQRILQPQMREPNQVVHRTTNHEFMKEFNSIFYNKEDLSTMPKKPKKSLNEKI